MKLQFCKIPSTIFMAATFVAQGIAQDAAPLTTGPTAAPSPGATAVNQTVVLPSTHPASPERVADYVLGPEDQIIVRAFQAEEIPDRAIQVGGDGYINLPLVGRVKAQGLTVAQLETELTKELGKYIEHPQVTILISDYRSQPVSVMGAVTVAGQVQLRGSKTLLQVISQAGGLRADAGNTVTITRQMSEGAIPLPGATTDPSGRFSIARLNVRKVMDAETPQDDIVIKKNDVLMVPKARMIYIIGEVQKPGGYVLDERDSLSLLQALSLAGGLKTTAAPKRAKVLREQAGKKDREEVPSNVAKILAGKAPDMTLRAEDILFVPNNVPKAAGIQALESAINIGTGLMIWRL